LPPAVGKPDGRPSFRLHQNRMQVRASGPALLRSWPVQFVFDLLRLGDTSLLTEPYERRRAVLEEVLSAAAAPLRVPPFYVDVVGADLLALARENGLEGVVTKRWARDTCRAGGPGTGSRRRCGPPGRSSCAGGHSAKRRLFPNLRNLLATQLAT